MAARHRKCPTPDKVKYETFWAAERAAIQFTTRPYKCRQHWHVTSKPKIKAKRVTHA